MYLVGPQSTLDYPPSQKATGHQGHCHTAILATHFRVEVYTCVHVYPSPTINLSVTHKRGAKQSKQEVAWALLKQLHFHEKVLKLPLQEKVQ